MLKLDSNERTVLQLLRHRGAQSRTTLAHESGLGPPTLTRVTKSLTELGLLQDLHKVRDGHRGKPAQLVTIQAEGAFAAGITVQAEYLSVCVVDLLGRLKGSISRPLERATPEAVGALSAQLLGRLLQEYAVPMERLLGIGICMPGVSLGVLGSGLPSQPPHVLPDEFAAWREIDLHALFSSYLPYPIWFENSAKAATLADAYFGAAQSMSHFMAIHFAYGLGGGLWLDRRLYRGWTGRAGEIGAAFPFESVRASGRDLLLFLSDKMPNPPTSLKALSQATLPPSLVQAWVERVNEGLVTFCAHVMATLDLQAIVLNGLLPHDVVMALSQAMRARLPLKIAAGMMVPDVVVSRMAGGGLDIGAASLPIHYTTSPSALSLGAAG